MSQNVITISKVTALPATLTPNTLYFILNEVDGTLGLSFTDTAGTVARSLVTGVKNITTSQISDFATQVQTLVTQQLSTLTISSSQVTDLSTTISQAPIQPTQITNFDNSVNNLITQEIAKITTANISDYTSATNALIAAALSALQITTSQITDIKFFVDNEINSLLGTAKFASSQITDLNQAIQTYVNSLPAKMNDVYVNTFYPGNLTVKTGTVRWYPPKQITFNYLEMFVSAPATGSDIVIALNKNAVLLAQYTLPQGQNTAGFAITESVSTTDYLTYDIVQIGSTNPGTNLQVRLTFQE